MIDRYEFVHMLSIDGGSNGTLQYPDLVFGYFSERRNIYWKSTAHNFSIMFSSAMRKRGSCVSQLIGINWIVEC